MKNSGYFQAIFLALIFLASGALPASSYSKMETRVGDVEIGDPHFEKKAVEPGSVSEEEQNLIVLVHESYRALVQSTNMMKLRYNEDIAKKAQALADTCVFGHDTKSDRAVAELPGVYVGQNICKGQSSWADCINAWAKEKDNFEYGIGSKNGRVTGHYTQMMLWKTMAIGCGFNSCGRSPIYVCNYAYGQNANDLKAPWKSGKQCTDCPNSCTDNGFCDCGGSFCSSDYKIMAPTCECKYWWLI